MSSSLGIVARLCLGRRYISDRLQQASVVEPVRLRLPSNDAAHRRNLVGRLRPLQGGELHGLEAPSRITLVDHLGLEQAVDGFRKGIVVGGAHTADRGLDACLGEAVRVAQRKMLPCDPLSERCTRPWSRTGRRWCRACSRASSTAVRRSREPRERSATPASRRCGGQRRR